MNVSAIKRVGTLGLAFLCAVQWCSAEPGPTRQPDRREVWVPSKHWQEVLKNHPKAVMLTPKEYEALIRDAGKVGPGPSQQAVPAGAVVESLHFKASAVDETAPLLRMEGTLTLRCLTDEWTEVTARLPFRNLAAATVDGSVVLGLPEEIKDSSAGATQRKLLVKGKGIHRITLQILAQPGAGTMASTRALSFSTIDVPAVLDLQLPAGAQITQATTAYTIEGSTARVLLHAPGASTLRSIAWTTSSGIVQPAQQTSAVGLCTVTDHHVTSEWTLNVQRSSMDTATTLAFDVIPPDAIVLNVDGEGITRWEQNEGKLQVTLRDRTHFLNLQARVQSAIDLQAGTTSQSIVLPTLRFQGRHLVDSAARVTSIADGVTLMEYQGVTPSADGFLHWNSLRDSVKLLLRKADPRISADADTLATVTRDDLQIERTLQVQTDRTTSELRVTLPAGEEFLSTSGKKGPVPEWKRSGQTVEYRWPAGLTSSQPATMTVSSRKRLNPTTPVNSLTVENLTISEANKLAGYLALDFDPTWRVGIKTASGLEERDSRTTPVKGKMAWFALRTFNLAFEVQRRDPIYDAEVTAYALPRAKTIEIEGQISLEVFDAPLRQLKVAVAKDSASLVRFTSPLVGEQTLDAATGVWSLSLRKESLGRLPLRFRLSLPATQKTSATGGTITLEAQLPAISVAAARRHHGVWVVEANTDTELTFDAKGMQPLDVMRAPAIDGYEPRHRLVAAFQHGVAEASLTLHAARHGHSELAAIVVSDLRLTSVLGRDGGARHQAALSIQHSGEQFFNLKLPGGAQLLTVLADSSPVKPVRGPDGALSIPLPGDSANRPSVPVRLLYETPGDAWNASGRRQLDPPSLAADIPVLATSWEVYVPDGYSFKKVNTTLEQEGTGLWKGLQLPSGNESASTPLAGIAERKVARRIEPQKGEYYDSARDQARAKMLNDVAASWEMKAPSGAARDMSTYFVDKMKVIRLPSLQFKDATVDEALEFLRMKSRDLDDTERDPSRRGINIILKAGDTPSTARITLDLKDVPMEEALRYVTELAGMKYKVEPFAVLVVPVTESTTEQYTRVYKAPPDFLNLAHPAPGTLPAAKDILISQGIPFPDGASAFFNPVTSQLIVKNTAPNLELVETFVYGFEYYRSGPAGPQPITAAEFAIDWPGEEPVSALAERLKTIRLPSVQFTGATLQESVDFLKLKSQELDPEKKGVQTFIKAGLKEGSPITLDLKDVPFEEALRYVTELAGVKYKLTNSQVIIVPHDEDIEERTTRTWAVPTKFAELKSLKGPVKDALQAEGIAFPQNTGATYDSQTHRLTVTNTPNNLFLVEAHLEMLWNRAQEKPPIAAEEVQRRLTLQKAKDAFLGSDYGNSSLFPVAAAATPGYAGNDPYSSRLTLKEGLLPLELELPSAGQRLRFHGPQGPVMLALQYVSWERQIVHALLLMLAGAILFLALGRRRIWSSTILAIILVVWGTGLWAEEWQPRANALLLGWITALVLTRLWNLIKAFETGMTEGRQA